jgi:hypothetical protein
MDLHLYDTKRHDITHHDNYLPLLFFYEIEIIEKYTCENCGAST